MKQHYFDEETGISYTLQGDYYLPNLTLPIEENKWDNGVCGISSSIGKCFTRICSQATD